MSTKIGGESFATSNSFHKGAVWGMILVSTLGMIQFGYIMSILNTLMKYFGKDVYHFTEEENTTYSSVLNTSVTIGACIGALVAGPITQKLGRRSSIILIDIVVVVASCLTLISSVYVFIIGRVVGGFCVGFNSTLVPLFVNETAPLAIKGLAGTFNQLQICLGALFAVVFGFGLPEGDFSGFMGQWWRFMLGFPILIGFIRLGAFMFFFKHDTPKYLVFNHQSEQAEQALSAIYHHESVREILQELEQTREAEQGASGKITFAQIFGPKFRFSLAIACFIALLQQMTGVNAFIFYSTAIFENGRSPSAALTLTVILNVLNFLATLISGQVTNRFGRKTLLIAGDVSITITLVVTAILFLNDATGALIYPIFLFIILFGFSYGPIPWIFISEILPDVGVGVAVFSSWSGAALVAALYPVIAKAMGPAAAFGFFGIFGVLALFVLIIFVKETAGLTPAQITELYSPKETVKDEISLQGDYGKMTEA